MRVRHAWTSTAFKSWLCRRMRSGVVCAQPIVRRTCIQVLHRWPASDERPHTSPLPVLTAAAVDGVVTNTVESDGQHRSHLSSSTARSSSFKNATMRDVDPYTAAVALHAGESVRYSWPATAHRATSESSPLQSLDHPPKRTHLLERCRYRSNTHCTRTLLHLALHAYLRLAKIRCHFQPSL